MKLMRNHQGVTRSTCLVCDPALILRGTDIFTLPKICTTTYYGLNSFSYQAIKSWNTLPNQYRTVSDFNISTN